MAEDLDSIKLEESEAESSERRDKGLTLPAVILGGAMGLFSVLLVADVGGGLTGAGGGVVKADGNTILLGVGKFFSPNAPVAQSVWAILLAVLVINPLMRAMKVRFQFTTKELIVATTIASLPWGFAHYVMLGSLYPQLSVGWLQLVSGHHVARTRPPSLFEPYLEKASPLVHIKDVEVFRQFAEGGYQMDWGAWFFPTLTASLFVISIFLVSMSIAVIVRRRLTDQEHLRFPIVVVRMSLIEMQYPSSVFVGSTAERKSSLLRNGVFYLGVLLGALEVSGVLKSIWPWWPIQGRFLTFASQTWQQNVWKLSLSPGSSGMLDVRI